MHKTTSGFTIVELLIVVVVIAILAAISVVAYSGFQKKARDSIRMQDLKQIQKVVELYKAENGLYPIGTSGSGAWSGRCSAWGGHLTYIQGVDSYMPNQPLDPKSQNSTSPGCYLYRSNGTDYMVLAWQSMEAICGGDPGNACNTADVRSMDRVNYNEPTMAVYSPGAVNW